MRNFIKEKIYGPNVTILPTFKLFAVVLISVFNSVMTLSIYSYLPQLVKSFGTSEVDTGGQAGIIASSHFIPRIFSSFFWGYMTDRRNKIPVLIAVTVGTALSTIAFGFSTSLVWAVIARLISGLSSGHSIVSRAILFDISDSTNQQLAMVIYESSYSTGMVLGPIIGGYASFPAVKYPNIFDQDGIFGKYPILLPNLALAAGTSTGIVILILAFPSESTTIPEPLDENVKTQLNPCIEYRETDEVESFDNDDPIMMSKEKSSIKSRIMSFLSNTTTYRLLSIKHCVTSCILSGLYYMLSVGYQELFPVFAATAKKYNGYEFSTKQIGLSLLITGCFLFFVEIPLLGKLSTTCGSKKMFILSSMVIALCFPMVVTVQAIQNRYLFWSFLILLSVVTRLALQGGLVAVIVLVNNSVPNDLIGSANGLLVSFTCVARGLAPAILGSIFTWSLKNVKSVKENEHPLGLPFDQYFIFFVLSILSIFNAIYVSIIPDELNNKLKRLKI